MKSLSIAVLPLLILIALTADAQLEYDQLEDIGPDGTPVTSRTLDGVTVTITPQGGLPLTARTYDADTLAAFNGGDHQRNRPLNPGDVSGTRFISNVGDTINFVNAQPIMFEFDQPVSVFGLTTLDLLEDGEVGAEIKLQAFDQAGSLIDEQTRLGPQGPSGLDLDWRVSGQHNIVKVLLTGSLAGGFSGYGIDDLVLALNKPDNHSPVARNDAYLYLDYFNNADSVFRVLENDSDPDGDAIRVLRVGRPSGTIVSFDDSTITYFIDQPLSRGDDEDHFDYHITDGQYDARAFVDVFLCQCPIQCVSLFVAPSSERTANGTAQTLSNTSLVASSGHARKLSKSSADDSLEVDLFRHFRDEILLPTETGTRFVDLYYRTAPEVMPLLIFTRPDIGVQAFTTLRMMQEPLHNLVVGDGTMPITQTLVDEVSAFLDNFTGAMSDSLRHSLNAELARLGPLQDLVGLSVAEAFDKAFSDSVSTSLENDRIVPDQIILEQNFPNPFRSSTQIRYSVGHVAQIKLVIYNILGQEIKTLVDEVQLAGDKSVIWDGTDGVGRGVPSGLYFYRLSVDMIERTKEMLLVR